MWSEKRGDVTAFQIAASATLEDWLIGVLDEVELHHGEYSQSPSYNALRVIGTGLSQRLRAELESYGFSRFEEAPDGFFAHKMST
jgi:hypothetical protein